MHITSGVPAPTSGTDGQVRGTDEPSSPEEAVIMLLMQAGRRLRTRHIEDSVDPSTFPLAKQLFGSEGMRVSELATRVGLDASTVSRQIKQLEDKDICERTPDPADGRASLVRLSESGREIMVAAFRRRFARIQGVLEPWSDSDRALLQHLLTRLAADLGEASDRDAAVGGLDPSDPEPTSRESVATS